MKEKLIELCKKAQNGKISFDDFYDQVSIIAEDVATDGDLACLLEDVLMELEMIGGEGGSKKTLARSAAESISRILDEMK